MMTSKKYNDENINLKIIKSTPTPIPEKKGFWSSLFDDSSSEEDPKEQLGTQIEDKGFWRSLFDDSSESDEKSINPKPKEKGFWSSLFGNSSDSSDNKISPTDIENLKYTKEKKLTDSDSDSDSDEISGIIISGIIDFIFCFLHSTNASKIALHCIS